MDRTVVGVSVLALGLPYLSMIALAAIGSVSSEFVSGLITTSVILFFVTAALFEVKRLVDQADEHEDGTGSGERH